MCRFFSAIVIRNGDVLWHEATDSHSDLIQHFKLPDNTLCNHFAKVEFVPAVGKTSTDGPRFGDVDAYTLIVDEDTEPAWFADVRETVLAKCRSIIRSMIVDGEVPLILGGCRILVGKANVQSVKRARIVSMSGTSSVGSMSGTSSVGSMYGTSSVGYMYDTSSVGYMYGTSSVGYMYDTSSVGYMSGTSRSPMPPKTDNRKT